MLPHDNNEKQLLNLFRKLNERNQKSIIESVKELADQQNSAEFEKDTIIILHWDNFPCGILGHYHKWFIEQYRR